VLMSQISIVAYSFTLTEMHYLFFIVGQPDVDMCMFIICIKTHYTAQLLLKLLSQTYDDDRLLISYGKMMTSF